MANRAATGTPPALFQSERQRRIVALTIDHSRTEVAELADRFGVTTETIRRDLSDLQAQRLVRRVHGGAVPWEVSAFEPLLSVRNDHHDGEKRRLARRAIDELPEMGTVIIDSGSTLNRFAEAIPRDRDLHVITNSILTATTLAENDRVDVTVLGGRLHKNTLAMVDPAAVAAVAPLSVDTLFISSDGLTAEMGLTTPYRGEAALKQAMIAAAHRVVALVDHSKVGRNHLIRFAEWSDIDLLITNREADPVVIEQIEAQGTTVVLS